MNHKIIVHAEKGRPDSLMEPMEIVFTLTPSEPEAVTHPYNPVALGRMSFHPNTDERQFFEWQPEFTVRMYYEYKNNEDRKHCSTYSSSMNSPPGHTYWMLAHDRWGASPPLPEEWDPSLVHPGGTSTAQSTIRIANAASEALEAAMQIKNFGSNHSSILAFKPLQPRGVITASTDLMLQAYVAGREGSFCGHILTPEYLTKPIFDKPIKCSALPAWSSWRISQGFDGTVSLKLDEGPPSVENHSFESVAKSVNDLRKELASVLTTLDATQQRLASVETAVANNHVDISTSLGETRDQVSRLDRVIPAVQAKMAEFEAFIGGRSERRPIAVVKSGIGSRGQGNRSDRVAKAAMKDSSAQGREAATADAGPSSNGQDHSLPATTSISPTSPLLIGVTLPTQVPGVVAPEPNAAETKLSALVTTRSAGLQGSARMSQPEAGLEEVPGQARGSVMLQESLRTLRQQVTGLDRRIPALESMSDKLAGQFGQTLQNLVSMDKFMHDTRAQVAELEQRLPTIGDKVDQLTESIATTDDYLEDLASRVTAVEDRAETFVETLIDIRHTGVSAWGSFLPSDNPSARLPCGIADSSFPTIGASVTSSSPSPSLPPLLPPDIEEDN